MSTPPRNISGRNVIKKWLLLFFLIGFSIPVVAEESSHRLTFSGLVRLGKFDLTQSAVENLATPLSYKNNRLENALGKLLFVDYAYDRFGVGARWISYSLAGSNSELEQTLDLTYSFMTASYVFLAGDFLHPDVDSRIGLAVGTGQNKYELSTKSRKSLTSQTVNESVSATDSALLSELFYNAITRSGWGYKMGYAIIHSVHSRKINNKPLDGSSAPHVYMTIAWRY
jgi:hypothetical protein